MRGAIVKIREILSDISRTLQVARKPTREEIWTTFKICFLGLLLVGFFGFTIKFISTLIQAG
ncbi:MAG: protein translocase SEC61 complex subunit gamma [Thermoproteota archaeon]|nr:MAG: protein translocase SEC61 complex subunit gamma [Candidatus Korarchaeota archaeon]RLG55555.1 MAG: protein translocase SEC61 complex subunit gamma [Candidatus Korarchaeota archaeon]